MDSRIVLIGTVLGGLAFCLHLSVFILYSRQVAKGRSRPNVATWSIWAFVAALNCLTFFNMSQDWIKSLQPLAGSLACLGAFLFALFKGKLTRLNRFDGAILAIGLLAVLVWRIYQSAALANLILQAAFLISFMPTMRDVWRDPAGESPWPWLTWGLVYLLTTLVVLLRWSGHCVELVYPLLAMVTHSSVGLTAWLKRLR